MKLETFFEKFNLFADAPDAVAEMRALVLQLAVQGSLVPHLPEEAAVPYASVEDATPINVSGVPANWRVMHLSDAIKNRSGNSKLIKGKLFDTHAPHLFQGFSASGADVWCEDYEHEGQAIIISAVGARCGKAFKASGKWSAIANTNIARPEPALFDFDFAYLVLNDERFWVRGGSAQPFVKFPSSLDRHFALPPLAEQKRIVAKVDELMALCDRLALQQAERETRHAALARASLARFADAPTPANLPWIFHSSFPIPPSDLRKSILTLAVQGKLVPQDPNGEDTRAVTMEELVGRKNLKNGLSLSPVEGPSNFVCLPLSAMKGSTIDCSFGKPIEIGADRAEPYLIKPRDIFVIRGNGSKERVGIAGMARACPPNVLFPDLFIRIPLPPDKIDGDYFLIAWNSPVAREMLESLATTTAGIWKVNQGHISECEIPLPPLAEQRRIVAKVDELMALVDALETQLATARTTATALLAAALAELTTA